jgi:hypothetical protein
MGYSSSANINRSLNSVKKKPTSPNPQQAYAATNKKPKKGGMLEYHLTIDRNPDPYKSIQSKIDKPIKPTLSSAQAPRGTNFS